MVYWVTLKKKYQEKAQVDFVKSYTSHLEKMEHAEALREIYHVYNFLICVVFIIYVCLQWLEKPPNLKTKQDLWPLNRGKEGIMKLKFRTSLPKCATFAQGLFWDKANQDLVGSRETIVPPLTK